MWQVRGSRQEPMLKVGKAICQVVRHGMLQFLAPAGEILATSQSPLPSRHDCRREALAENARLSWSRPSSRL